MFVSRAEFEKAIVDLTANMIVSDLSTRIWRLPLWKFACLVESRGPSLPLLIVGQFAQSARDIRPLWPDFTLEVWAGDPLHCPSYRSTMKPVHIFRHPEQAEQRRRPVGILDRNPRGG